MPAIGIPDHLVARIATLQLDVVDPMRTRVKKDQVAMLSAFRGVLKEIDGNMVLTSAVIGTVLAIALHLDAMQPGTLLALKNDFPHCFVAQPILRVNSEAIPGWSALLPSVSCGNSQASLVDSQIVSELLGKEVELTPQDRGSPSPSLSPASPRRSPRLSGARIFHSLASDACAADPNERYSPAFVAKELSYCASRCHATVESISIRNSIQGYVLRAQPEAHSSDQPKKTVLMITGTAQYSEALGMDEDAPVGMHLKQGHDVVLFNYRGYGASAPIDVDQNTMNEDANAALEYVVNTLGVDLSTVILHGYSMGAYFAAALAGGNPTVAGLVLDRPMSSAFKAGRAHYGEKGIAASFAGAVAKLALGPMRVSDALATARQDLPIVVLPDTDALGESGRVLGEQLQRLGRHVVVESTKADHMDHKAAGFALQSAMQKVM